MNPDLERQNLVNLLAQEGIRDPRVLQALGEVPRHSFIPRDLHHRAYENNALPIGFEQTISQPFVVAHMAEVLQLRASDRVLEIGTGSGYHAAVLARLVTEVHTVERLPELHELGTQTLEELGYHNVYTHLGDGSLGLPEKPHFNAISVTAAAERVPPSLLAQLANGGRLVIPVGERGSQILEIITRHGDKLEHQRSFGVRFVPLLGEEGW